MISPKRPSPTGAAAAGRRKRPKLPAVSKPAKKKSAGKTALRKILKARAEQTHEPWLAIDLIRDKTVGVDVRQIRFGAVTVSNTSPDAHTVIVNLQAGRDALERAKVAFMSPGVKLNHARNIPTFRVDADNPTVLIREMNGRLDRGQIIDGSFVPAD